MARIIRRRKAYRVEMQDHSGNWMTLREYTAKRPADDHCREIAKLGAHPRLVLVAPDGWIDNDENRGREFPRVLAVMKQF